LSQCRERAQNGLPRPEIRKERAKEDVQGFVLA